MLWPGREVCSIWPSVSLADDRLIPGTTWYSRICTCNVHMLAVDKTEVCESAGGVQKQYPRVLTNSCRT